MSATIEEISSTAGRLLIEKRSDGLHRLEVQPEPGFSVPRRKWVTAYPDPLIRQIFAVKDVWVCDEIMREEDPGYVEHHIRHEVINYLEKEAFAGKRILDFGCGSGASTMVLARLLSESEIVGIELFDELLRIARVRAEFYGAMRVRFLQSPSGAAIPDGVGQFDYVMFNAVFEHLLPDERPKLLRKVWTHLRPGGTLFLNQTPHRWSPYESHTTQLPLINYLPDAMALHMARLFSKSIRPDVEWEELLRCGIRGASVGEILDILREVGEPVLLKPIPHVGDRIDLWYGSLSSRFRWFKRSIWANLKFIKFLTGIEVVPSLALAIRKNA